MIADPSDSKPADWDSIPETITDPTAEKPEDWDDDEDGEWEAPTIPNPDYKGEWQPRMIANPEYKGEWLHPLIPNPDYHHDDAIYSFDDFSFVGIDIWQVKSGTIFDNLLITDSLEEANNHASATWGKLKEDEKKKFEEDKEAKKAEADNADDLDGDDEVKQTICNQYYSLIFGVSALADSFFLLSFVCTLSLSLSLFFLSHFT
jgi:calreticulin